MILDDYDPPGYTDEGRQEPIISAGEAKRLRDEYYSFWAIYWLMQPYKTPYALMDFDRFNTFIRFDD